jgi:hypothetical protein
MVYALGALKNVGVEAMQLIVGARAGRGRNAARPDGRGQTLRHPLRLSPAGWT